MGKKYQTDSEATTNFRHVYTLRNFSKNKRNNLMIKKTPNKYIISITCNNQLRYNNTLNF